MKFNFKEYNSKLPKEGQVCVHMYKGEGISVYGSDGNGAEIPFEKVEGFINYMRGKVNGAENVKINIGNKHAIEIPKSKIEIIANEITKVSILNLTAYRRII